MQVVVLLGGALMALIFMANSLPGGFGQLFTEASASNKFRMAHLQGKITDPVLWVVLVGGFLTQLVTYSSDQVVVQRYSTTPTEKEARKSIYTNALLVIPASLIFFCVGTALWVFFKHNPASLNPNGRIDDVFPWYISNQLPVGLAGLVDRRPVRRNDVYHQFQYELDCYGGHDRLLPIPEACQYRQTAVCLCAPHDGGAGWIGIPDRVVYGVSQQCVDLGPVPEDHRTIWRVPRRYVCGGYLLSAYQQYGHLHRFYCECHQPVLCTGRQSRAAFPVPRCGGAGVCAGGVYQQFDMEGGRIKTYIIAIFYLWLLSCPGLQRLLVGVLRFEGIQFI